MICFTDDYRFSMKERWTCFCDFNGGVHVRGADNEKSSHDIGKPFRLYRDTCHVSGTAPKN